MPFDEEPEIPAELVQELKRRDGRPLPDASEVDLRVRAAAQRHFGLAIKPKRRTRWQWLGTGMAAAALLGLAVWVYQATAPIDPSSAPALQAHDFNRDGRVDILDAMRLAQHLESPPSEGGIAERQDMDVNRDGRVDLRDVDALGQAVVSVSSDKAGAV